MNKEGYERKTRDLFGGNVCLSVLLSLIVTAFRKTRYNRAIKVFKILVSS
jgi:hypothetical protein